MARPKGSKNKSTIEKENAVRAENVAREVQDMSRGGRRKLAKERLEELADVFAGQASHYQNAGWRAVQREDGTIERVNNNPNYHEDSYRFWFRAYQSICESVAQYQSPKLSAVAVGQVTKLVVVVKGGLPPRNTSPAIAPPAAESGGVAGPEPDNAGGGRGAPENGLAVLTSCAGFPTPCALIGSGAAPYRWRRRSLPAGRHPGVM
jgi:hypothetical protein